MRVGRAVSLGAAALVALAVVLRLTSVLGEVPNKNSITYDAGRRAMLNVGAADALRSGDLLGVIAYVAGPEIWPTFRLVVAAPVHALAGPEHALAVEEELSIAFVGALVLLLSVAARQIAGDELGAAAIFAVASVVLLGVRPLLEHAADGMLEVPSALMTLAATTAWLAARDRAQARPWLLALTGNALFHVKWQHGMIFAALVLGTELLETGAIDALRTAARALWLGLRRGSCVWLAVVAGVLLGAAAWVRATGGAAFSLFGHKVSLHTVDGPIAFGALALFGFLQRALWLERASLRQTVSERVRFLWCWLATPMAAWLLVPFTWRLRVLGQTSFTYDSGQAPPGLGERLFFYPHALWSTWFIGPERWAVPLLIAGSLLAARRSARVRRLLVPFGAIALGELVLLTLLSRKNFQPRFLLNVSPLLALFAGAWLLELKRPHVRVAAGLGVTAMLATWVAPVWSPPELVATMSRGFERPEVGDDCRKLAETVQLKDGLLVNRTADARRQACAMWVTFVAREHRGRVKVVDADRLQRDGGLLISDGTQPLPSLDGLTPEGPPVHIGPLTAQRFAASKPALQNALGSRPGGVESP
jgi:hypothetical protein